MSEPRSTEDDEIDLREIAASLIAGWKVILLSMCISSSLAVLYAVNAEPTYEAKAVFELKSSSGGPAIPSEYAGLASLAGISMGGKGSKGVFDRVVGRDFITRLSDDVNLESDEYFNPPQGDPSIFSLSGLTSAMGLSSGDVAQRDHYDSIRNAYNEAVSVKETKNGSIEVSVTHKDADRAAVIANAIVARVVKELSEEEKTTQREQLSYLSDQLADALSEMEASKKSVADFALANSLSSPTAFAARSELMFDLRDQLRRTQEMALAVDELSKIMSLSNSLSEDDYRQLKTSSPIIDDVDFRRLIGVPEALDAWSWPPRGRLGDFSSTLADRIARIERSIDELMEEAELYAASTEELATLQREATVAEATYSVLIEQVKAQSLITGYQGEKALFYQSATPPDRVTSPKKKLIAALGLVLGLMIGAMIAVISSLRSGKLYTASSIFDASGASLFLRTQSFRKSSHNDAATLSRSLSSKVDASLTELQIAQSMHPSRVIVFCSTGPTLSSLRAALWMSLLHKANGKRVAVLSFGEKPTILLSPSRISISETSDTLDFEGIDLVVPKSNASIGAVLTSQWLHDLLSEQNRDYDVIVISSTSDQASNVMRSFSRYSPYVVAMAKPGASLRKILEAIRSISAPNSVVSMSK
jgi:uncharacterized protein involved in exopolysaccharide biosynthesis